MQSISRRDFLRGTGAAGALLLGGQILLAGKLEAAQPSAPPRGVQRGGYLLDTAVYGGELQYFRTKPSDIPDRLALCKEAGFSVIQTYVPWNVHEFFPGIFDFTGRTHPVLPNDHHLDPTEYQDYFGTDGPNYQDLGLEVNTDLESFLGLCAEAGFAVILRPGPFISDEWRNGGLPDWFLETAPPDMYEYGPDGTPFLESAPWSSPPETAAALGGMSLFYFPSPSYASPYYLSGARGWLTHFAEFVRPWLSTNGGPVVATQVDDETCYYYHFGPFEVDYNPAMVARYVAAFGETPPKLWPLPEEGVASLRPAFRWQRFKSEQIAVFLGALAADLRSAGVDVPITHEMELSLAPPADFAADAKAVLVQPELYPGANGPEAVPLIELTAQAARASQRNQINVWSAETQAGQVLLYSILLGEGIIGALQFTYSTGVPDGAVAATGRLGKALRTAGPLLTESRRRADVAIVWDNYLTHAPFDSQRWGFRTDVRAVIGHHVPALATLLVRSGLSFDLLDVNTAQPEDYLAYPTIFLASSDILPRSAQEDLVGYVRRGGRLVCWPAPPYLDEELGACTVLADACFPEKEDAFYPEDDQQIEVLGLPVVVWMGVQTFNLSGRSEVIATRQGAPCGYRYRFGSGSAILLGAWPAASSVPGRAGVVLDEQQAPADPSASLELARTLAAKYFGDKAPAMLPDTLPAGNAETWIVYAYTNQRRGGTYLVAGGALAYWNGEHVVGLLQLTAAESGLDGDPLQAIPYRPPDAAHVAVARALAAVTPQAAVSDLRIQARVLDSAEAGVATVVANNRWGEPIGFSTTTTVGGRSVRLPSAGDLVLPAGTGIVMPVAYPLPNGAVLLQATAQLLEATAPSSRAASMQLWAPGAAEVVVATPGALSSATLDDRPIAPTGALGGGVVLQIPVGTHQLVVAWS